MIDWTTPWQRPWCGPGRGVAPEAVPSDLPRALNALGGAPVRFIPQSELPEGVAYESHIFATGGVPTRDNLHDLFNALCWMRFPQTKRRLNALQAAAIDQSGGVQATRGPLRDALTLFDENALLLQAPEPLWQALRVRDWPRLFAALRPLWAQATAVTFGHALTEKLVVPYKSITAHVLCLPVPTGLAPDPGQGPHPWDAWLAAQLTPDWLATKPFTPLPVLGIPGWWPANEDPGFYADTGVFRPPRPQSPT
ncbi:DUF3025 domain-containing protein [Macromonas nakdongensis]|uniref:DUF3025 domain-containing protein n=1 Tax=Macromonas nakdongensis TaxID=1843082 RepID=UPI0018E3F948|nr:DUF3025 domain-containing protein [Macromonas nakdongensis]